MQKPPYTPVTDLLQPLTAGPGTATTATTSRPAPKLPSKSIQVSTAKPTGSIGLKLTETRLKPTTPVPELKKTETISWSKLIDTMINEFQDIPQGPKDLIQRFKTNNDKYGMLWNGKIPAKENNFRIMTFNIHYWKKWKQNNQEEVLDVDGIIGVIVTIDPDIVCLQEFLYVDEHLAKIKKAGYDLITMCPIVPSWFDALYGNAILIKHETKDILRYVAKPDNYPISLCAPGGSCYLGQKIVTYPSCCSEQDYSSASDGSKVFADDNDKKCYIKISLPHFDIFCVHLNAYEISGKKRIKELSIINADIIRPSIIMGDFNALCHTDYYIADSTLNGCDQQPSEPIRKNVKDKMCKHIKALREKYGLTFGEIEHVKQQLKWQDVFDLKKKHPPLYSNWTGFRVDYIFVANWDIIKVPIKDINTLFTNVSDHIPLFIDLNYKEYINGMEPHKIASSGYCLRDHESKLSREDIIALITNKINPNHYINVSTLNDLFKSSDNIIDINTIIKKMKNIDFSSDQNINELLYFNGQPIDQLGWIDTKVAHLTVRGEFDDPTKTGSTSLGNKLGGNGIYGTSDFTRAIKYARDFTDTRMRSGLGTKLLPNTGVLFCFTVDYWNEPRTVFIGRETTPTHTFGKYKVKLDDENDIIFYGSCEEIKVTQNLYKGTTNPYLKLKSILVFSLGTDRSNLQEVLNMIHAKDNNISSDLSGYPIIALKIGTDTYQILQLFNSYQEPPISAKVSAPPTLIAPPTSVQRPISSGFLSLGLSSSYRRPSSSVVSDPISPLAQQSQQGGMHKTYYQQKYSKYKSKYLLLKNNKY